MTRYYMEQRSVGMSVYRPAIVDTMPTVDETGRIKTATGLGPQVRNIVTLDNGHEYLTLQEAVAIYGTEPGPDAVQIIKEYRERTRNYVVSDVKIAIENARLATLSRIVELQEEKGSVIGRIHLVNDAPLQGKRHAVEAINDDTGETILISPERAAELTTTASELVAPHITEDYKDNPPQIIRGFEEMKNSRVKAYRELLQSKRVKPSRKAMRKALKWYAAGNTDDGTRARAALATSAPDKP